MIHRPLSRRLDRHRRRAFTLMEVLIALGLTGVLLGLVYAALDMHWRYTTAGQDEVARSLLARSVLQRIARDLRSVQYRLAVTDETTGESGSTTTETDSASDSSSGSSSSGSSTLAGDPAEVTTEIRVVDPSEVDNSSESGLRGDAQTVILHISRPTRDWNSAEGLDGQLISRTSDLQSVSYFLSGVSGGSLSGANGETGLARTTGDRLAVDLADQEGNTAALAQSTQVLAPEVTYLQFRYFNGSAWLTAWDSVQQKGLPLAVEITIEVALPQVAPGRRPKERPPKPYRLVVPIPIARPLSEV